MANNGERAIGILARFHVDFNSGADLLRALDKGGQVVAALRLRKLKPKVGWFDGNRCGKVMFLDCIEGLKVRIERTTGFFQGCCIFTKEIERSKNAFPQELPGYANAILQCLPRDKPAG